MTCTVSAQAIPDSALHWVYKTHTDEMSGESGYSAIVVSPDTPPMSDGNNMVSLVFYIKGKMMFSLLSFLKGMIPPSTTTVEVKFDDGPVEYFACESNSDKLNSLVLTSSKVILKRLEASHKMMIRVPFYQEESKIFHFNIEGFKLPGT